MQIKFPSLLLSGWELYFIPYFKVVTVDSQKLGLMSFVGRLFKTLYSLYHQDIQAKTSLICQMSQSDQNYYLQNYILLKISLQLAVRTNPIG